MAHKNEIKRMRKALRRLKKDYDGYTGQDLEQIAKEIKRSYLHVSRSVRGPNAKTELQGFTYQLDINQLCNLVESTNHQKRVARANERGRLRISHRRVSIGLEGAELILGNIFLYNCVMNKELILQKKLSPMIIQHVRLIGPR